MIVGKVIENPIKELKTEDLVPYFTQFLNQHAYVNSKGIAKQYLADNLDLIPNSRALFDKYRESLSKKFMWLIKDAIEKSVLVKYNTLVYKTTIEIKSAKEKSVKEPLINDNDKYELRKALIASFENDEANLAEINKKLTQTKTGNALSDKNLNELLMLYKTNKQTLKELSTERDTLESKLKR